MEKFFLKFQILSIFIGICLALDYVKERPPYLKECEIKKPGFTKCATESMQGLVDQVVKGIPTLKSFQPIDPFKISKVKIRQDGLANIKAELTDVIVRGFRKATVKDLKINQKDYSWKAKINLPYASLDGNYAVKGRIFLIPLPLNGNGQLYGEIKNMDIVIEGKTKLFEKGGLTFANMIGLKLDYTISDMKFEILNLFNGNKELEDTTNEVINENWELFVEILKPAAQETIAEVLMDTLNKIFLHIPAEFFITDIPTPSELYG